MHRINFVVNYPSTKRLREICLITCGCLAQCMFMQINVQPWYVKKVNSPTRQWLQLNFAGLIDIFQQRPVLSAKLTTTNYRVFFQLKVIFILDSSKGYLRFVYCPR